MKSDLESMKNERDAKFWRTKKPQICVEHIEDFFVRKTSRLPFFMISEGFEAKIAQNGVGRIDAENRLLRVAFFIPRAIMNICSPGERGDNLLRLGLPFFFSAEWAFLRCSALCPRPRARIIKRTSANLK